MKWNKNVEYKNSSKSDYETKDVKSSMVCLVIILPSKLERFKLSPMSILAGPML
jgi:hypothetical protein